MYEFQDILNIIEYKNKELIRKYLYKDKYTNLEPIKKIYDAVLYSMQWWKLLRSLMAVLVYAKFKKVDVLNINNDDLYSLALSIECFHSYSLIHDDLPAIDNDKYRRWKETVWYKYWEDFWLFVWDLLISFSLQLISEMNRVSDLQKVKLINLLTKSNWLEWVVWWQVLDVFYSKYQDCSEEEKLIKMHKYKTAKLFSFSLISWFILAWENDIVLYNKLWLLWEKLWVAFQVKDDILDYEWSLEQIWKNVWKDKSWFVKVMWIDYARNVLDECITESIKIANSIGLSEIQKLIMFIKDRRN